jgi:hypothetical protein
MGARRAFGVGVVLAATLATCGVIALSARAQVPASSPVNTPLDTGFEISQGIRTPTDDAARLPFESGSVRAHWYQYFGFYVVRFVGLNLDTGYCVGTSTLVDGHFVSETNSPTSVPGDCPAEWPKAPMPLGAYDCGGELVYRTAISTGAGGTLHATIRKMLPTTGVNGAGLSGSVAANLSTTPIIDLAACTKLVPPTPTSTATTSPTAFPTATATSALPTATPTATRVAPGPPATGNGLGDGEPLAIALLTAGASLVLGGIALVAVGRRR